MRAHRARLPEASAWIAAAVLLAALYRLYVAGDRDIVAVNGPYDEYWYVASALRLIWGGAYNHMAFAQLPVYSGWIAFLYGFGIPGRLGIDAAWIAGSAYLAFAIGRFTARRWTAVASFAFLAFHPSAFLLFDRALSESLLTVLTAFALGGFIEAYTTRDGPTGPRRVLALIALGAAFGLAFHTRKEGIVLFAPLGVLALASLLRPRAWWSKPVRARRGMALIAWPIACVAVMGLALALANAVKWGVAVRYELAAPGYVRALDALAAIDPAGPTPKQVTVTRATRLRAYAVSPTFAQLRPFFEGPVGDSIAAYTAQFTGTPGEIANGWFYWALRDGAADAGWHVDARTAESKYNAMASEIQAAFRDGRLHSRPVPISFVDPDLGKWLPDVPSAALRELELLLRVDPAMLAAPAEDATPTQFSDYVRALGRRNLPQRASVAGWITAPPGSRVGLGTREHIADPVTLQGPARPDVPGGLPFRARSPEGQRASELAVETPDGKHGSVSLNAMRPGTVLAVDGLPGVHVGVDEISGTQTARRGDRLVASTPAWTWFTRVLALAGVLGLSAALVMRDAPAATLIALSAIAILARVALLSILDASSWNGLQARYLVPALPFLAAFGFVGAATCVRAISRPGRHPPSATPRNPSQ